MSRCPICGKFTTDELPHKEQVKSTFVPRHHGHGASNHGDPEMHDLYKRQNGQLEEES
jgi:hypothetical protein